MFLFLSKSSFHGARRTAVKIGLGCTGWPKNDPMLFCQNVYPMALFQPNFTHTYTQQRHTC